MFLNVDMHLFWTVLNMAVLFLLARKFLFGPVREGMQRRRNLIQSTLDDARQQKEQGEALHRDGEQALEQARREAVSIVRDARVRGDETFDQVVASARRSARHIAEQTRSQLKREEMEARERLRLEVSSLALAAASKLMMERHTDDQDKALIDKFCEEQQ